AKLDGRVTAMTAANDFPCFHVERCKERRRAVANVVMCPALELPGPHRQQRLRAIERLNLRFLIDTQHQRMLRRIQIQPDNVPYFVDEEGIARQLERLRAMRLQAKRAPDAAHRALTE